MKYFPELLELMAKLIENLHIARLTYSHIRCRLGAWLIIHTVMATVNLGFMPEHMRHDLVLREAVVMDKLDLELMLLVLTRATSHCREEGTIRMVRLRCLMILHFPSKLGAALWSVWSVSGTQKQPGDAQDCPNKSFLNYQSLVFQAALGSGTSGGMPMPGMMLEKTRIECDRSSHLSSFYGNKSVEVELLLHAECICAMSAARLFRVTQILLREDGARGTN